MEPEKKIQIIGSDAGGTMTDMFFIDQEGNFVVGKASTTPRDESVGFWESMVDGAEYWGIDWEKDAKKYLPQVDSIVYCGTATLNVLLTRKGRKIGLICTRGHEDSLLHERGRAVHAGYSVPDKLHQVTHIHNEPLVPRKLIKGVTERMTTMGEAVVPLYEHEAREAVEYLISKKVDGIVVWFLWSYLNPMHEWQVAGIAAEVMKEKGVEIPLYLSSQICPITREVSRLTSTLLHAYSADPARKQLMGIEKKVAEAGYDKPLQIVLSSGSLANIRYPRLHEATFCGPIGGIMGSQYLCDKLNIDNLVCTDMGGTSFDVGLIMGGEHVLAREVEIAHMIFNIPTVVMDSIGAGTGQLLKINPETGRLEIGPESAGADPGPVCYRMGNETPTVMDCCLIMGILNPDNYLGGKMKLDKELALKAVKEKCADPLGVDPYAFSEGVLNLINLTMREHVKTVTSVRGFSVADYYCAGYGGAGPMFLAGYTAGLPFRGVFTVPYAAAFSAFGCTATDYVHRYQKSTVVFLPNGCDAAMKMQMAFLLNIGWQELEQTAIKEMTEEGVPQGQVHLKQVAYVRYMGQMEDVEVESPVERINSPEDMDKLIAAFEEKYARIFFRVAQHPESGFQIMELGVRASAKRSKPAIRKFPMEGANPPAEAFKEVRKVYHNQEWYNANIYDMETLKPGNIIDGISVIEAPSTTLFVPIDRRVRIDEHKLYWLEAK